MPQNLSSPSPSPVTQRLACPEPVEGEGAGGGHFSPPSEGVGGGHSSLVTRHSLLIAHRCFSLKLNNLILKSIFSKGSL